MTLQEYVNSIKDKKISVIGAGVSNMPLIRLLLENGCDISVRDARELAAMGNEGEELAASSAKLILGKDYLENISEDIVFRTPGLMPFDPHLVAAKDNGSIITSEMEVFFRLCPCRIFAVTGSDGKTTTTTIISELLKAAGYRIHLGGNIGKPLLCELPEFTPEDIAVLELSSFQLHSMQCTPNVAVVTNISPNHLDKHIDYKDYYDSKMQIFNSQRPEHRLILNAEDETTEYYRGYAKSEVRYFSDKNVQENGSFCEEGVLYRVKNGERTEIMRAKEITLPGVHNLQNYLAAFAATEGYVSEEICREVAMNFAGVEHRLETVRVRRGVTYINDSIGSSPTRTIAGLRAMKKRPIVIAGGYDKHIPFDELGDELCMRAKAVFLTGATAGAIQNAIMNSTKLKSCGLTVKMIDDFDAAVYAAAEFAEEGDIVLLSPACAAFDKFKNFMERGKHFKKLVMELEE